MAQYPYQKKALENFLRDLMEERDTRGNELYRSQAALARDIEAASPGAVFNSQQISRWLNEDLSKRPNEITDAKIEELTTFMKQKEPSGDWTLRKMAEVLQLSEWGGGAPNQIEILEERVEALERQVAELLGTRARSDLKPYHPYVVALREELLAHGVNWQLEEGHEAIRDAAAELKEPHSSEVCEILLGWRVPQVEEGRAALGLKPLVQVFKLLTGKRYGLEDLTAVMLRGS